MNLFAPSSASRPDAAQGQRIKAWFREALALDDAATLTVAELRCSEPGCPEVETVVGVLRGPGRQRRWKFACPLADLTREQVSAKLAEFPFYPNENAHENC